MKLYNSERPAERQAYAAGDMLIATLYALNLCQVHVAKGESEPLWSALAYQTKGSAYQLTSDALAALIRQLTADVDPDGIYADRAMDMVYDIFADGDETKTIVEWIRTEARGAQELALACGCENATCDHPAGECSTPTGEGDNGTPERPYMVYVGHVCVPCARTVASHGGAVYVTAPFGTYVSGKRLHG